MGTLVSALFEDIAKRHRRNLRGIEEARAAEPDLFASTAEMYLAWLREARGSGWLETSVDAYARFSSDVILAQARYEAEGRYAHASFQTANAEVYSQRGVMDDYLWGVYLTNFLWPHHMEIMGLFLRRFVAKLPAAGRMVEVAPGHGGWGIRALHDQPGWMLEGFDISPSSIAIASALADAAGVSPRCKYQKRDALDLGSMPADHADALICSFLVEHLEDPERLFAVIGRLLKPGAPAFITGALTAAQVDHIFEFHREGELVELCERHGMRVRETMSVSPSRLLPNPRFLPRSMALLVTRRAHEHW